MKSLMLNIAALLSFDAHALQFDTDWFSGNQIYKNRGYQSQPPSQRTIN